MSSIAILGCGVVGAGVADMLTANAFRMADALGAPARLAYIQEVREVEAPEGVTLVREIAPILADPDVRVVVETIGGAKIAYTLTKQALESGRSVVTSNKELVATYGDELCEIAARNRCLYLYEAAVGGGIPLLRTIRESLAPNGILHVNGIVNGSTNYLLTRMEDTGLPFPAALGEAKSLGYVEGNPAADIEGWDARRKLAILAHEAFGARFAGDETIPTLGIQNITQSDLAAARLFGGAVKLIAHAERRGDIWEGWVHPAFVPNDSPLYGVRDVFNGVIVHGDYVGDVMFYGRGAGGRATASAVVGDVLRALDPTAHELGARSDAPAFDPLDDTPLRAVVRVAREGALDGTLPGCVYRKRDGVIAAMTPAAPKSVLAALEGAPLYVL